jgi:acetyl esterase/lipase
MRTVLALLAIVSLAGALLPWYPFASESLWPLGAVARELWPWLLAVNALGLLLASRRWRPLLVVFVAGLGAATWPLMQIASVKSDFAHQWHDQGFTAAALDEPDLGDVVGNALGGSGGGEITPEALPLGIQLYRLHDRAPPRAILVNIHGGSWQHGSARSDGSFASYFANRGWAVFSVEYRHAPEFTHPAQIEDVRAALEWIYEHAAEYGADPSRIALAGRSAGGQLAMLAGYTSERIPIRAVVEYYGPADLNEVYRDPPDPDPIGVRDKLTAFLGGTPAEVPQAYREASPANYVHAAVPPTLHIQGTRDNIVQAWLTRDFHRRLLRSGARSLLLELPWSDHSFDFVKFGPGNALALRYSEAFLIATVAGDPSVPQESSRASPSGRG